MRPNKWEYTLDQAAPSIAKGYADEHGEAYLSLCEQGGGVTSDGSIIDEFASQKDVVPLGANLAATQLGVLYELSSE